MGREVMEAMEIMGDMEGTEQIYRPREEFTADTGTCKGDISSSSSPDTQDTWEAGATEATEASENFFTNL